MRGTPSLFRRHSPEHRDLLVTCLLIRQHNRKLMTAIASATPISEGLPVSLHYQTELPILGGQGRVDLVLTLGKRRLACEISTTNTADEEAIHLMKCPAAGFAEIIGVCDATVRRHRIETLLIIAVVTIAAATGNRGATPGAWSARWRASTSSASIRGWLPAPFE